ncbi:MAG: site-specific integrase [Bacillota bacterium]|nr:site-specific integrase [Bacillota bacterium]
MAKGYIREIRPDVFELQYDLPTKGGRRKRKSVTFYGKKREAEKELRRLTKSVDDGTHSNSGKMTVEELLHKWMKNYVELYLSPTTIAGYKVHIDKHILPILGKIRLDKLQPDDIQEYYTDKLRAGLSARTVLHHHRILHAAMEAALKWQLIGRNICKFVVPPKAKKYKAKIYDMEQLIKLLAALMDDISLYIPVLLVCATGMRRGEVLGLRWKDIDSSNYTATVSETKIVGDKGVEIKSPKTEESIRRVSLPPFVIEELERYKVKLREQRLAFGEGLEDADPVCHNQLGLPWCPKGLDRRYRNRVKQIEDLPYIRFHDLRHSHASFLLMLKIQPKVISERLGHSNIGITMDTYSHLTRGMQESVAAILQEVLFSRLASDGSGKKSDKTEKVVRFQK